MITLRLPPEKKSTAKLSMIQLKSSYCFAAFRQKKVWGSIFLFFTISCSDTKVIEKQDGSSEPVADETEETSGTSSDGVDSGDQLPEQTVSPSSTTSESIPSPTSTPVATSTVPSPTNGGTPQPSSSPGSSLTPRPSGTTSPVPSPSSSVRPTTTPSGTPRPTPTRSPVPTVQPTLAPCAVRKPGLVGKVYELASGTRRLPDFTTLTPLGQVRSLNLAVTNRAWTRGFPGHANLTEWFAIDYSTSLEVSSGGDYYFQIVSDDGAKVYVNGAFVINNDGIHGARRRNSGKINLTQGRHTVRVSWFQGRQSNLALELLWKKSTDRNFYAIADSQFSSTDICGLRDLGTWP